MHVLAFILLFYFVLGALKHLFNSSGCNEPELYVIQSKKLKTKEYKFDCKNSKINHQ